MMLKRQGDILFELLDAERSAEFQTRRHTRRQDDGVIAQGEMTGHAHRLEGGDLLVSGWGQALLVPEAGRVVHEEHDTILLEPGVWLVHRQTEYLAPGETAQVYD